MNSLQLTLNYPPSINHYYKHICKRGCPAVYIGKEGVNYRAHVFNYMQAFRELNQLRANHIFFNDERLSVQFILWQKDKRVRDIDNPIKPLLDALQKAGIYKNDSQIDKMIVMKMPACSNPRVEISIGVHTGI